MKAHSPQLYVEAGRLPSSSNRSILLDGPLARILCVVVASSIIPRRILTPCSQFSGSSSLFTFTSGTSDARKPRRYQRLSSTTTLPSKRMSSRSHPLSRANGLACSVKLSKISPGVPLQIAHSFTIECTSARVWKRRYRSLNCSFVKVRNAVSSGRDGER